jgi:hypothetical protein
MTKTGFCTCLRPGEGDSDIDGTYGIWRACETISQLAKFALDTSGKSVA